MISTSPRNSARIGFTLIELLVVISIIAILAALLIGLVPQIQLKAKLADTQVKMNSVQQGMSLIGQSEGSATYRLQQLTEHRTTGVPPDLEPGLGGIMTFGPPDAEYPGLPTVGKRPPPKDAEYNGQWGERGRGHLGYPWGKKFPDPSPTDPTKPTLLGPERFLLRHMSPFNTRKLLKIANILPIKTVDPAWSDTQYMTNRKPSEIWNDAWGHPLVVAATLYQPTHLTAGSLSSLPGWKDGAWPTPANAQDAVNPNAAPIASSAYMPNTEPAPTGATTAKSEPPRSTRRALLDHLKLYQYNRSVYISVAAVGPHPWVEDAKLKSASPTDWASSATKPNNGEKNLDELWSQVNWVCQQAKTKEFDRDWSELSMDNPMWQGNKYDYLNKNKHKADANIDLYKDKYVGAGMKDEHCLLSAPQEYK